MPTNFESKSLSWVGNICQKLETFYHEIDNNFTQDTVRYVEVQVHNVGENMKKFYSDVIQDLIPLSCETHAMAQESSAANGLEHHGITEGLIPRSCDTQGMVQENNDANGSEYHGITEDLIPRSFDLQGTAEESNDANTELLNKSLAEAQVLDTVKSNQCDAALQMYFPDGEKLQNSNHANDLNHATTISDSSANEVDCSSKVIDIDEADCPSEIIDTDEVDCPSEVIDGDKTASSKDNIPIDNICSSKVSSDIDDLSVHDDHDVDGSVLSVHSKSLSSIHFESETVDMTSSTSGSLLLSELADAGMGTIDLSDKLKDDDSCVIVDNSFLYEVPLRHCGKKSYKKKLQDAFSSKRRLVKEYKLLAIIHGDIDVASRRGSVPNQLSSSIIKASDAEWEIL